MKITKRKLIKGMGSAGLTGAFVAGSASASGQQSAEQAGIQSALDELLENGKIEQARRLLSVHDVEGGITEKTPPVPGSSDSDSVGTQDYFEKSNSSISFSHVWWDTETVDGATWDRYKLRLYWDLNDEQIDIDLQPPVDVAVTAWEQDVFGFVNGSLSYWVRPTYDEGDHTGKESNLGEVVSKPPLGEEDNAVVLQIDDSVKDDGFWDNGKGMSKLNGELEHLVRKQANAKGNLGAQYTHTWSPLGIAMVNVLEYVTVTITGGISVDVPTGADSWDLASYADH